MENELDYRVGLKNLAAMQLPEFIRSEYPTFVAFVEAYYEYLDNQGVNLTTVRDIDETLEDYIKFFKAELAHNYPVVSNDYKTERFLLKHIKDQYLAKGSEASYKLLFRLLYGKDVYIDYPGRQMLRVSDGRWQQDVSLFVKVFQGDAIKLIGKTVTIQTSKRIYNTKIVKNVDAASTINATVENVLPVNGFSDVFEIFLDRNFYGNIVPGDSIKYASEFQARILPCTAKVKIAQPGKKFKPGQVFQISSGEGTPFWFKVATIYDDGGLKTIDLIRFGLQYNTDFSLTVLPGSAVSTKKKSAIAFDGFSYNVETGKIPSYEILDPGADYTHPPTITIDGNGSGATAHAIISNGQIVEIVVDSIGSGYTYAFVNVTNHPSDPYGHSASIEPVIGSDYYYSFKDKIEGFTETGYLNWGDYWSHEFSDGSYVGTIARQFFINAEDTLGKDPAVLNVSLDAVAKYPGYYRSNDGFLDDSMFIQDSYYYQAFAYVLKIDEQLESYASVIRSMLHPSGMAMFGEYSINNKVNLSIGLDSLVKSLGVTLYDNVSLEEVTNYSFIKDLSSSHSLVDSIQRKVFGKLLIDTFQVSHGETEFSKVLNKIFGFTTDIPNQRVLMTEEHSLRTDKDLNTTQLVSDTVSKLTSKYREETVISSELATLNVNLNMTDTNLNASLFGSQGYITLEPYDAGGYFSEIYANERPSSWST